MSSSSTRFTIIEWAVAAVLALLVARLIWAHELLVAEERFLAIFGLDGEKRFLVAVPLTAWSTLWSSLPPNGIDTYVLTAQAGQTMTVNVIPASGQALLSISGANGEVLKSAGAGSSSWSGVLPLTQDYFIAVSAPGGSAVDYTLQVTIPPR